MTQTNSSAPPSSPHLVGLLAIAGILSLVALAAFYVRQDERFTGAVTLTVAVQTILERAVDAPSPEVMFEAAAAGMVSALDPFSGYMPPREFGWFTEDTQGEYVGIGIEIAVTDGEIIVVHVFPHSPAADALIRPGDRLVAIDGHSTFGFTPADAATLMRGRVGTPVSVELENRRGEHRTVALTRDEIPVTPFPVAGISRSGLAYIRWSQFSSGSGDQLAALVDELVIHEPDGLILDLRGNPGGILDEAVAAAGVFLPADKLVCWLGDRELRSRMDYFTKPTAETYQGPLVIVLDETSASASEVLAAALWEAGRAVVVGRQSFGKGWVQSVFTLGDAGALRLSTAHYYTSSGRNLGRPAVSVSDEDTTDDAGWQPGTGLEPDVEVARDPPGPWELALSQAGFFAEFAAAFGQGAVADEIADSDDLLRLLREWCDSLNITPVALAENLLTVLADTSGERAGQSDDARTACHIRELLQTALVGDADVLLERERDRLLQRVWQKRLWLLARPDPGELESYLDVDMDLTVARDILEEPERYQSLLTRRSEIAGEPHPSTDSPDSED